MKKLLTLSLLLLSALSATAARRVYDAATFGITPDTKADQSARVTEMLKRIKNEVKPSDKVTVRFAPGRYDFHPEQAVSRQLYISNHDQDNPKSVGIMLEDWRNLTLDGQGADFIFHGQMLPLVLLNSERCTLRDFHIDFENPHIVQVKVISSTKQEGTTFEPAPWVQHRISDNGIFEAYGKGWAYRPQYGIAFDGETRHLIYNTSDMHCPMGGLQKLDGGRYRAPRWHHEGLKPGSVVALREWHRPTPGIVLSHNKDTRLEQVTVHYANGMGLLAQLCENITLEGFNVCLRGDNDPRYFTTQADATHFSSCKGLIHSVGGLYEGMMDDAINVHGTYLKVVKRIDDHTLEGRYMHHQAWGFDWGFAGDKVQFVRSNTMELCGEENIVASIEPADKPTVDGARVFRIRFEKPIAPEINEKEGYGIENLTWTPKVYFAKNTIRNNRARGSLFSTPLPTVVEDNLFDHTSGCAILLCGDCNGWFETGACRDVTIRRNRFINALTNQFQFTNAVISIYPEIPNLAGQKQPFHGGKRKAIRIENNEFETFDAPILYAKSVRGLLFRKNTIRTNTDFPPLHWNRNRFLLEHVQDVEIEGLLYDFGSVLPKVELQPIAK